MRLGDRFIASHAPPYIIAEVGVNHDGSTSRALDLVNAAAEAGADAIKLQLFETDRLLSKAAKLAAYQKSAGASDPFAMLRSLELPVEQMRPIVDLAHERGVHAIVTVFSVELVDSASELPWDAYKTASPDVINQPLLEALRHTGRPLIVSCGAATIEEVVRASRWIGDHPHVLMHCVSAYPTPDDHAAIAGRMAMRCVDPASLGYSDHTTAIDTGAIAVASGARVLEKHLTYDRHARGPDHAASLEPESFAQYVQLAHRAFRMMGPIEKRLTEIERDVHMVARQSLTTTRDLRAGQAITRESLTIKRPGTGLPPWTLERVVGRTLAQDVAADMPLHEDDLQ